MLVPGTARRTHGMVDKERCHASFHRASRSNYILQRQGSSLESPRTHRTIGSEPFPDPAARTQPHHRQLKEVSATERRAVKRHATGNQSGTAQHESRLTLIRAADEVLRASDAGDCRCSARPSVPSSERARGTRSRLTPRESRHTQRIAHHARHELLGHIDEVLSTTHEAERTCVCVSQGADLHR